MRTLGKYLSANRTLNGDLVISFTIDDLDLDEIQKLADKDLVIEVKKYSPKRSLTANAYFWVLCDEIAKVLGTTKDEIYLLQLSRYGFWLDKEVHVESIPEIKQMFRYVEEYDDEYEIIDDDGTVHTMKTIRCYLGSSHYSKTEMARLIDGTVQDAHDIGISTWNDEEVERLIQDWRAR